MKPVQIPRRVDEPPHVLLWSVDELAPILLGLTIGMVMQKALICVVIGIFIAQAYKKFKDNFPDGYLLHIMYWYGVQTKTTFSYPNSFIRNFLP